MFGVISDVTFNYVVGYKMYDDVDDYNDFRNVLTIAYMGN